MKLYNNDRNKREFQSFAKFTKKVNVSCFSGFNFYKEKLKYIEHTSQSLSKNVLIVNFHGGIKCLYIFFCFFHPAMKF